MDREVVEKKSESRIAAFHSSGRRELLPIEWLVSGKTCMSHLPLIT
jgi:hypothetical protein